MKTLLIKLINWLIRKFDLGNYISDGNHTFRELYFHRNGLLYRWIKDANIPYQIDNKEDNWPIVRFKVGNKWGSYHVNKGPALLLERLNKEYKDEKIEWDGHTSRDVLWYLGYDEML